MKGNFRGNLFQVSGSNRIEIITWEDKKNNKIAGKLLKNSLAT
jgi:hypothetical protein